VLEPLWAESPINHESLTPPFLSTLRLLVHFKRISKGSAASAPGRPVVMPPRDTTQPVREAPSSNVEWTKDPTRQHAEDEPVLAVADIQGNIVGGFNKDHQIFLFLRLEGRHQDDVAVLRRWLGGLLPEIATAEEVLAFNELFKLIRKRRGTEMCTVKATWLNIAFSFDVLELLAPDGAKQFTDEAFRQNLAGRAVERLNDPAGPDAEGNPRQWLFGKRGEEPDVVVIVASDDQADVEKTAKMLVEGLPSQLKELYRIAGATLSGTMKGHEHFGYLDGVSQPGLRGRASLDPFDVLTRRQNPDDPGQGKPGQDLIWPGEFVFGYPGQDPRAKDIAKPGPNSLFAGPKGARVGPDWAKDGSYLVVRRLRQDVARFEAFFDSTGKKLGVDGTLLGAKLVGRWKSGAPILRAPDEDVPLLGDDECANNHFEFEEDSDPIESRSREFCSDHVFPQARADKAGDVCPFASHIRKTYTRDDSSLSSPEMGEASAQTHRLLRRGIPFTNDDTDRGLLFACYQTSIVDQFEFVQQSANDPNFKQRGTGHDLIIGQHNGPNHDRSRSCVVRLHDGEHEIVAPRDFVIPTGGGYFFAPSIQAIERLSKQKA
jgi:Dyp-type peroxidase family